MSGSEGQTSNGASGANTMASGIGTMQTLQDLPEQLSGFGEAPALISFRAGVSETLAFGELSRRALEIARGLRAIGVQTGEPVGVLAANGPPWVTACLGILAAGAAAAPFDVQQSEPERARLFGITGCRFVFSDREIGGAGALARAGSCEGSPSQEILNLYTPSPHSFGAQPASAAAASLASRGNLALIVHTSGTTGTPKAVPLSHANIMANLTALAAAGVAGPRERALLPLPLHHIYPLVVGLLLPLSTGASVVLPGGISGPELMRAMRLSGATVLIGVPRLYESLLAAIIGQVNARGWTAASAFHGLLSLSVALARRGHRRFGRLVFKTIRRNVAPSLYRLVSGGAKLDEETELKLLGLGYDVLTGYGLSETGPILTFNRPGRSRACSAGEPLPGVELRIAEPEENGLGGVEVRGPNVFAGYRNDPGKSKAAFTGDGWFRTGDRGRIGADGYLYISGRESETIVLAGGKKLAAEALEAQYGASPAIGEIAILAEAGKLAGLVVPSIPARAHGSPEAAEASVRAALASTASLLPSYMQLSGFALTGDPLPRTQIGKLRRHLLPRLYRAAKASAESHTASHPMPEADRKFLADPAVRRVWKWLEARFPGQPLSLEMNPGLDLGIDSLGWVTVTIELEQAFGIVLDEAALSRIVTLRDLVAIASAARQQLMPEEVLPPEPGIFSRTAWYAGNVLDRLIMRTLFRLQAEGLEHLPEHAPYLICPNHASYLDPLALAAALPWPVLRRAYWAGAADILFSSGWRRTLSRCARVLAVDPAQGIRGGLALSGTALNRGSILIWFPEGWRSADGSLQPFLSGIGALVQRTPVPIIPVYIRGTFDAWPRQHRIPHLHSLTARFGPPLDPRQWAGLAAKANAEEQIARAVREAVAALGNR